ncbi:MAG: Uma2 family endonuclease [Polyangiaceae bacterium]
MSTGSHLHYSYEDYLALLHEAAIKLEYCDGVIYATAGGTIAHAALCAAAVGLLREALLGRCQVFTSDLKVRIDATDVATFPDVSVVCGVPAPSAIDAHAITNPTILVEVTSRSTEDYDRGDKLSHYKQLSTLRAVLFLSHRAQRVTLVERVGARWTEHEYGTGEVITLADPSLRISVDALYAGVTLDPA